MYSVTLTYYDTLWYGVTYRDVLRYTVTSTLDVSTSADSAMIAGYLNSACQRWQNLPELGCVIIWKSLQECGRLRQLCDTL